MHTAQGQQANQAQIDRGRYLAVAGDCISCHTAPGGVPFTGRRAFETPFGTLYSTNITPDRQTGIGEWSAEDLRRALHRGVSPGGRRLYPAFPYTSFTQVTDQDVDDIYAYLQSLKPERSTARNNAFLLRIRWPMRIWNALFFEPARYRPDPSRTAEWNRGAYLVEGLGHCGACHSPRNSFMAQVPARAHAGGAFIDEVEPGKLRRWSAINLTSAKQGLAWWSVDELAKYLRSGFSARAGAFGPMNEVIVNSLSKLSPQDTRAMAVYIKSLPPLETGGPTVASEQAESGAPIYKERCEKCHGASGRGGMFGGPPLAGSAVAQNDDPASLINVILHGPQRPETLSLGAWETMKPYQQILEDTQIAAVANFIRGSWGNRGRPATTADVAQQR